MTTPPTTPTPDVLTAPEVAARLGISTRRAYALIQRGYLPRVKMGRRAVRVPRRAFEHWLAAQDAAPVLEAEPRPEAETGAEMFARIGAEEMGRRVLGLLDGLEERQAAELNACLSYFINAAPRR